MDTAPLILLAAGGTGGHLFPAEALGVVLMQRGLRVRLATDSRALRYSGLFSRDDDRRGAERDRARPRSPVVAGAHRARCSAPAPLKALQADAAAEARGRGRLRRLSDAAAADRGAAAAASRRIIHDANAVIGRANRFLSRRVTAIATSLPGVLDRDPALAARPPPSARRCARRSSPPPRCHMHAPEPNGPLRLLVVGGSQGARVMADIVPRRDRAAGAGAVEPAGADAAGARGGHGAGARGL